MKQKQISYKLIQTPKVRLKGTPWTRSPRHHSAPKSKVHRRAICQDPMQLPRPQCCDAVATGASQVPPTASRRRLSAAPRRESSTHPEKTASVSLQAAWRDSVFNSLGYEGLRRLGITIIEQYIFTESSNSFPSSTNCRKPRIVVSGSTSSSAFSPFNDRMVMRMAPDARPNGMAQQGVGKTCLPMQWILCCASCENVLGCLPYNSVTWCTLDWDSNKVEEHGAIFNTLSESWMSCTI